MGGLFYEGRDRDVAGGRLGVPEGAAAGRFGEFDRMERVSEASDRMRSRY
jgi:hypothetical protein